MKPYFISNQKRRIREALINDDMEAASSIDFNLRATFIKHLAEVFKGKQIGIMAKAILKEDSEFKIRRVY